MRLEGCNSRDGGFEVKGAVLHLVSGFEFGGKERACLRLAMQAQATGWRTAVVTYDTEFRAAELDFDPGQVPTFYIPRRPGVDLAFAARLAWKIAELKPDILHSHSETAHVYGAMARALLGFRVALVSTFHSRPSGRRRWPSRLLGRSVTRNIAASAQLSDELKSDGWLHNCTPIVNGVDLNTFRPDGPSLDLRRQLQIPADHLLVGHIARFAAEKRHQDLVAAARMMQRDHSRVTIVCVGNGPLRYQIEASCRSLTNIRFLDGRSDIANLVRSLDALVLCSSHEATPLVVLEAMACAKPIVSTSVGGVPHLLQGDESPCGLLTPPSSPHDLAKALRQLGQDRVLCRELGERAYTRAQAFSFAAEWSAYENVYMQCIDRTIKRRNG